MNFGDFDVLWNESQKCKRKEGDVERRHRIHLINMIKIINEIIIKDNFVNNYC